MFEDSESESEAEAPAPKEEPKKPVAKKRRRPTPPPEDDSDSDEDRKRQVGPGFRRDEWRADALARSGAGDFGKAGSFVDRMAASFQAPRLVGPGRRGCGATSRSKARAVALDARERERREGPRGAAAREPVVGPRRPRGLRAAVDARPRDGHFRRALVVTVDVPRDAVADPLGEC